MHHAIERYPLDSWRRAPGSGLRATWLAHSTVLIEIDGFRVLTDPVWATRASPSRLIGPKRFQPVPVALKEMPPVDVVQISRDHYDHLDYPTIRALTKSRVPFVTSLGVGAQLLMPHLGEAVEPLHAERVLPWWREVDAMTLKTHPLPKPVAETLPRSVPWPLD